MPCLSAEKATDVCPHHLSGMGYPVAVCEARVADVCCDHNVTTVTAGEWHETGLKGWRPAPQLQACQPDMGTGGHHACARGHVADISGRVVLSSLRCSDCQSSSAATDTDVKQAWSIADLSACSTSMKLDATTIKTQKNRHSQCRMTALSIGSPVWQHGHQGTKNCT